MVPTEVRSPRRKLADCEVEHAAVTRKRTRVHALDATGPFMNQSNGRPSALQPEQGIPKWTGTGAVGKLIELT